MARFRTDVQHVLARHGRVANEQGGGPMTAQPQDQAPVMGREKPSRFTTSLTWIAVVLALALLIWGTVKYGFSLEVQRRVWTDIFDRIHGPMTFRFVLQPIMAAIAAIHDGSSDIRYGHTSFFWNASPHERSGRLREGLTSMSRVILIGISMDVIYQMRVLDEFYPSEAVLMALLLALIPYFLFRWIVEKVGRWWLSRRGKTIS